MTKAGSTASTLTSLVIALGIAQIVSWGSLFYAIGVLGPEMRKELGLSELFVFGTFTAALLVSGTLSPIVGRMVDKRGGRFVLSLGSALAALSLVVLAAATNEFTFVLGWLIAGAAMSACLYDPAFATLSQHKHVDYRRAITTLTIMGAFASTVFWPLSHIVSDGFGWRLTWAGFAALHLCLCLPLHLNFIPRRLSFMLPGGRVKDPVAPDQARGQLRWLAAAFASASFVFSVIAVHVVGLLSSSGLTEAQAISIAMLIGPMQVVGRIAELRVSGKFRAVTLGYLPFGLILIALLALANVSGPGVCALIFVVAFGCGNGILTIARGTVPHELFGSHKLGELLGYISRAGLYSRALAPASLSAMTAIGYSRIGALGLLGVVASIGILTYAAATRNQSSQPALTPGVDSKE